MISFGVAGYPLVKPQFFTAARSQKSDKHRRTQFENYFVHQVKGEVLRKFAVISNPKNVCLSAETKN